MSRLIINLGIELDNKKFSCSTIAILENTQELFYHFNFREKNKVHNGGHYSNIESGVHDHISFHKDGTIHITTKNVSNKTQRLNVDKLDINLFDLNNFGMFPFLIDSFLGLEKYRIINNLEDNPKITSYFWTLNEFRPFSIVSFLMRSVDAYNGRKITLQNNYEILCPPDPKQINMWLDNLGFKQWIYPNYPCFFTLFNGWCLYVVLSPFVMKNNSFNELNENKEIINTRSFAILPPQDLSIVFMDKDDIRKMPSFQII